MEACAMLGGNAGFLLITLLILAGVLSIVLLQKIELSAKRKEVDETRSLLAQMNFETTFFNLLTLHHERVRALEIFQSVGPNIQGRSCFNYIYYKSFVILYGGNEEIYENLPLLQRVQVYYNQLYSIFESDLSYYFRNLEHLLRFVDANPIQPKWTYIHLLRAQLSSPELLLLFYHGLSVHGTTLKPFIEKYALLVNLPIGSLLHADHQSLYPPEAFKDKN